MGAPPQVSQQQIFAFERRCRAVYEGASASTSASEEAWAQQRSLAEREAVVRRAFATFAEGEGEKGLSREGLRAACAALRHAAPALALAADHPRLCASLHVALASPSPSHSHSFVARRDFLRAANLLAQLDITPKSMPPHPNSAVRPHPPLCLSPTLSPHEHRSAVRPRWTGVRSSCAVARSSVTCAQRDVWLCMALV